jgi:EAL domain-containing protein (putative c-di-GMP-specific phosphodiesterase class I)
VPGAADIHQIIETRAIRTHFQPIMHLATGGVVGCEALSRGPAGSGLESPLALLDAAAAAGRLAELDWVCRTSALHAALQARLDPSLPLFVNAEPATLREPCPADLRPVLDAAAERLTVVVEMTERSVAEDPAALMAAVDALRRAGAGIALDDVGAAPQSLALLSLVRPDVVKLDLSLVHERTGAAGALVVNAVRDYAERSGAVVLAEGIETQEHARRAYVLGATLGQGWLFGRPHADPPRGVAAVQPVRLLGPGDASADRTPFEVISARRPVGTATKRMLLPMSRHLELQSDNDVAPSVLLGCFQEARHFTATSARRFAALAERNAFTAVLGVGLDSRPAPGVHGADLPASCPLRREWNVLSIGPHRAAALVARDLGDTGEDGDRRFEYVITHDRELALEAARALLPWVLPRS